MSSERIAQSNVFLDMKEQLIEENRKYWKTKSNVVQGDQWIYVYHGMSSDQFDWAIHENIVAKGLQEKTGLPVCSVIDGFGYALPEGLDESFGIEEVTHLFYSKYISEYSEKTTYEQAKILAEETYMDKDKLIQMEYRGIPFGNELYDYLLFKNWSQDTPTFDCFDISLERYTHDIRSALSLIDHAFELFEQKCPAYVITTERLMLKQLVCKVAMIFGAKTVIIQHNWPGRAVQISAEVKHRRLVLADFMKASIEYCIEHEQIQPEKQDSLFVFDQQLESENQDLLKQMGISNQNRNVFILPHAFVDVPRETYRLHFWHDYREWFLQTLEIIKKIQNVNWIIKDHPWTAYYKQNDYIKSVFVKNQMPNIYWCDSSINGMQIKNIADCVVTCGGEAALEYWAYEIPTITTAVTFFSDQGISYNIKNPKEYEQALKNISSIAKPSKESVRKARKILLAMGQMSNYATDELAKLFQDVRRIQKDGYRLRAKLDHIPVFCRRYMALLKQGYSFEKSCSYQMKNVCDVSL